MTRTVLLKGVEKEYAIEISKLLGTETSLTADNIIELSTNLYTDIKVKGISLDEDDDMLLFQYGTYNWGNELGEHFSFDITRQFCKNNTEDMYQLSLTLVFDPINFKELESYNSWSSDFKSIDEWRKNIKTTQGYEMAKSHPFKSYKLTFDKQ